MCGIAGFWQSGAQTLDPEPAVMSMMARLRHRGPDDIGFWADPATGFAVGHTRLSVIDLSLAGHQPMVSASGRYVIVFNGEVYNLGSLRRELAARGSTFQGHSDTTVILAEVEQWGLIRAIERFSGMFAFALYDRTAGELHLVRDRVGEKPLYHGWSRGCLLFGSELKGLKAHPAWEGRIDRAALTLFLKHNYVPAPHSIYEGIQKVPPGTLVTYRLNGTGQEPEFTTYWSAREVVEAGMRDPLCADETEVLDRLDGLLRDSVRQQLVADVPLGAFLSGGIDSSIIVALMREESGRSVRTFTIGFHEQAFNEAASAGAVPRHLGTRHTELYVTPAQARAVIPSLPDLYDEPFADSSQIPTHLVARLARRHVKASLSGDGGDELFGGYRRYTSGHRAWNALRRLPAPVRRSVARALLRLSPARWETFLRFVPQRALADRVTGDHIHALAGLLDTTRPPAMYRSLISCWDDPTAVVVENVPPPMPRDSWDRWAEWPGEDRFVEWMMLRDFDTYLPDDILVKVDRASMGVGLECRTPFLDHRIVEFAWRLPLSLKVREGTGKWILKRLLHRYVPRQLVDRAKVGFAMPIGEWLRGPLRDWASDLLDERRLREEGLFRAEPIHERWSEHQGGRRNWESSLWGLLMFEAWHAAQ